MPKTLGKIKLHTGPHSLGGPDNLEDAITKFITQAQKSLDIAVQKLDSKIIAKAIATKRPGVRVRGQAISCPTTRLEIITLIVEK